MATTRAMADHSPMAPEHQLDGVEITGQPLPRNAITADAALPWHGGPLQTTAGLRWYGRVPALCRIGISRPVRMQLALPIYTVLVNQTRIALWPRRPWLRRVMAVLTWVVTPDWLLEGIATWDEITGIRRRSRTLWSWSTVEFCIADRWVGVARTRTRALDDMWSAVVHFYRASRAGCTPSQEDIP